MKKFSYQMLTVFAVILLFCGCDTSNQDAFAVKELNEFLTAAEGCLNGRMPSNYYVEEMKLRFDSDKNQFTNEEFETKVTNIITFISNALLEMTDRHIKSFSSQDNRLNDANTFKLVQKSYLPKIESDDTDHGAVHVIKFRSLFDTCIRIDFWYDRDSKVGHIIIKINDVRDLFPAAYSHESKDEQFKKIQNELEEIEKLKSRY